jgi:benzoate 4-monooxygenase
MAILHLILSPWSLVLGLATLALYYIVPYYVTYGSLRGIPAPFPAQFTNLWLLAVCRQGKRYETVDEVHKKLGPVVRIQPNHVSIADDEAIQTIYGHGNGFLKSSFYDAFVSIRRGLFNTRDRAEHTRKRKIVSHIFAPKSILQFEPYITQNLEVFVKKWDEIVARTPQPDGFAHIECLSWFK